MKKCAFALLMAFLTQSAVAQETIPLFDDTPAPISSGVNSAVMPGGNANNKTNVAAYSGASRTAGQPAIENKTVQRPRLGRDAEPLTSIAIAPFPNVTIDIDTADRPRTKEDKTPQKSVIAESELIKRDTPLNMTESAKNAAQKIIGEKASSLSLGRHDVSQFKIANIHFGMDTEEVYDELSDLGYTLTRVEKSIPLFRTTYYDEVCRQKKGLTVLDDIRKCILDFAEENEHHYVFRETYTRPQSRETIQVSYSSPATNNVSYKIVYQNRGDNSLNSSRQNRAKKMQRHQDFWNIVFEQYGLPDENERLLWGNMNTRYMQATMRGSAYDAYIVLEDRLIQDKDYEAAQSDFQTLRRPTAFTLNGQIPESEEDEEE